MWRRGPGKRQVATWRGTAPDPNPRASTGSSLRLVLALWIGGEVVTATGTFPWAQRAATCRAQRLRVRQAHGYHLCTRPKSRMGANECTVELPLPYGYAGATPGLNTAGS